MLSPSLAAHTAPLTIARTLLRAARPHHWAKNALIFVPLLLAHRMGDGAAVAADVLAFVSFSACASGVYLVNDVIDRDMDRQHPEKRHRPIAAGELGVGAALGGAIALFVAAFACAILLLPPLFTLALAAYCGLTFVYSLFLKRKLLVDVLGLAALHTLRILAGNAATGIPFSSWLLAFSMFLFLSLAMVKRFSELQLQGTNLKGRGYRIGDLEIVSQLGVASGFAAVLVLALYVDSQAVRTLYQYPEAIWLICPMALYVLARIWVLARRQEMPHDPLVFILRDWRTWLMGAAAAAILAAASW